MNNIKPLDSFLSFAPPLIGDEEIDEVTNTLRSGWLTTGPKTERFEQALSHYLGCQQGVAVNSCTAALHLALRVLGVEAGQGVITTPLTFASTAHAISYVGARPHFVDIDFATGNLNPALVREYLQNECELNSSGLPQHRRSGDIITTLLPVHYGGHPVDLKAFWELATEYNLNIVEDAAHALGAAYQGLPIGHLGHRPKAASHLKSFTAFSFYATKNISTGEGGYLCASNEELTQRARVLSMYGISDSRQIWGRYAPKGTWVYDVAELGFKYNMMDIQAALGLQQLKKLPGFIQDRRERADIWNQNLLQVADLLILPSAAPEVSHAWHLYPLRLKPGVLKVDRDQFINILRDHNLGTSVLFIPLHFHSYYRQLLGHQEGSFPEAEAFFANLINLPLAPAHSSQQISQAAVLLTQLLKEYAR